MIPVLLLSTVVVQGYVNSNNSNNGNPTTPMTNLKEPSTLPIQDPKLRDALQKASQVVNSKDDVRLVDAAAASTTTVEADEMEDGKHTRTAVKRQRWGVDKAHQDEYWFDNRIHSMGNIGFSGAVHAFLSPFATKLIDMLSYEGQDVRHMVRTCFSS